MPEQQESMGGERSSTTRRLAGKVCCLCGRHLDAMLWQPPDERVCEACETQRSPTPKLHRIHMSFVLRERWHCTFLAEDLRSDCASAHLQQPRFNARNDSPRQRLPGSACRQAVDLAIQAGRGNVDLLLPPNNLPSRRASSDRHHRPHS